MARRTLHITLALAASGVLLLSACGGSDDESPDKIKGADSGDKSSSAASDTKRPDLSLPSDLKLVFDWDEPADPEERAALADAANYIRAWNHGIVAQDENDPAYQYYSVAGGSRYVRGQIGEWVKGGWTATGTDRYYSATTQKDDGGKTVLVTMCRNQAKFFGKEVDTGKVLRTEESMDSYQKLRIMMAPAKDTQGLWQAQQIKVTGKVKECRE